MYKYWTMGRLIHRIYHQAHQLEVWLTLRNKPINYSFRNKTGRICWAYCLKFSNTPQWWWYRPNLERHKGNSLIPAFIEQTTYILLEEWGGGREGGNKLPKPPNPQTPKWCKSYCLKPIWLNFAHYMCIYI